MKSPSTLGSEVITASEIPNPHQKNTQFCTEVDCRNCRRCSLWFPISQLLSYSANFLLVQLLGTGSIESVISNMEMEMSITFCVDVPDPAWRWQAALGSHVQNRSSSFGCRSAGEGWNFVSSFLPTPTLIFGGHVFEKALYLEFSQTKKLCVEVR